MKNIKMHSSIIAGFRFESLICTGIDRLDVLFSRRDEALSNQPDGENVVFRFKSHISKQDSNLPVTQRLMDGTLVYLRPGHPVMDAVAYIKVDGMPWLLFIQVSLSEYGNHKSQAKDLCNQVTGCEKREERCTWIEYYRSRLPESVKDSARLMYVYISPKNLVEGSTETLKNYGLRDQGNDIYFGMFLNNSESAMFIATQNDAANNSD